MQGVDGVSNFVHVLQELVAGHIGGFGGGLHEVETVLLVEMDAHFGDGFVDVWSNNGAGSLLHGFGTVRLSEGGGLDRRPLSLQVLGDVGFKVGQDRQHLVEGAFYF